MTARALMLASGLVTTVLLGVDAIILEQADKPDDARKVAPQGQDKPRTPDAD
jgi:hypothetical protein